MLPPVEVYTMLDVSPTTLRRWAATFRDYLSPHANKARRKYTTKDVAILHQVKEMIANGILIADIPAELDKYIDPGPDPNEINQSLALPGLVAMITDLQYTIETQSEDIIKLQTRIDRLERPWYRRLFDRD